MTSVAETVGTDRASAADEQPQGVSRAVVALLAIAVGAAVANIYYVQPLLNLVARSLGVSDTAAGFLVTCSQAGYLLGLALLVPLGDLRERRRLITTLLAGAAVALSACAAAPGFAVLAGALLAAGALSAVAQIIVPLAATLAAPEERGRVVGTVMSGLLIGILSARIVSGVVAELGGYRLIFALGAAAMLTTALLLRRALPVLPPVKQMPYRSALASVVELIGAEPVLRQRMALGALQMAGFTMFWTAVAFLLGGPPYDYGEGLIGLFGLAGVAGALVAPLAGRLADRGHGRRALTGFLGAILLSWALLAAGGSSLIALIAGIVLLDIGIQGSQISNQSRIYELAPEARSRLTTAYMVALFFGGVVGSILAANVYDAAGWHTTCALGASLALTALAIWATTESRLRR
ncbi:MAG TPA: MFS transporter [Solirubrobacteraceae bacterium]|nr:MFS transporter [Solirubrobacteraceae bacterium]